MSKQKIIAFYLPQYHPTPDNDRWWGKGFTEWTNVGKAKPLFRGHYQPKVPADLGYYDLRLPEVREAQAELAKEAGIYGFCYYHYWFGNGKEELELPFNEVLRLGKPDFPFMLCWANESWHKKFWNKDGVGSSKEMLVEQTYPGEQDDINHFYRLLPAFKDSRYIKIDGKPAFMIYKPFDFPSIEEFLALWNKLAVENGLKGISFIAHIHSNKNLPFSEKEAIKKLKDWGFDFFVFQRLQRAIESRTKLKKIIDSVKSRLLKTPLIFPYTKLNKYLFNDLDTREDVMSMVWPNWDHTPRSEGRGLVLSNSTPSTFSIQLSYLFNLIKDKRNNIIFVKSWNEWGEGNYLEPDLKYGKKYLNEIKEIIKS